MKTLRLPELATHRVSR